MSMRPFLSLFLFASLSQHQSREYHLKGKAQYSWLPSVNCYFALIKLLHLLSKMSYLRAEVNCTESSPLVGIPSSVFVSILSFASVFVFNYVQSLLMSLVSFYVSIFLMSLYVYLFLSLPRCMSMSLYHCMSPSLFCLCLIVCLYLCTIVSLYLCHSLFLYLCLHVFIFHCL